MNIKRVLFSFILSLFSSVSLFALEKPDTLHITVFIHGSVHSHLSLLSPKAAWSDTIEQDAWYFKMLSKVRQNPLLWQTRFMLGMGPQEVSADIINRFHKRALTKEEAKYSAYHIVAAYDAFARRVDTEEKARVYFLYGHLGMLSQSYRKNSGQELYFWLADLAAKYKQSYSKIQIDVVAHSHGGNIALWLGAFEDRHKRGLFVDNLVMYATPIQVETFRYAYRPAFGHVYNLYSDGDPIQGLDRLSTERGKSYKNFSHPDLPVSYEASEVYDVRLLVNNKRKHMGHGNMFMMDFGSPVSQALKPVPFAVFTPAFLSVVSKSPCNEIDCNLVDNDSLIYFELKANNSAFVESENLFGVALTLDHLLTYSWKPANKSRLQDQPSRFGKITINAIRELWHGGDIKEADMPKLIAKL
jgi:hypothetical protein